jgi:hypothetical protein
VDDEVMNVNLLRRTAAYYLRLIGLPGIIGLGFLIAALFYVAAIAIPAKNQHNELAQSIAQTSAKIKLSQQGNASRTPAEQLADFYAGFPRGTTIPDWLGKIYAIAEQQKLDLEIGEYSLTQKKSDRLDQFRIVFPVKGSYPQIRRFIRAALATAPALALDNVSIKRDKVGDGVIDAQIVFLLYLEKSE